MLDRPMDEMSAEELLQAEKDRGEGDKDKKSKKKKKRKSSSSSSSGDRRAKRKKQQSNTFSNFSSFDQGGGGFTGKTFEERTAEEQLFEMLNGPMTLQQRDQKRRQDAKEAAEKAGGDSLGKGKGKSTRPTPPPQQRSTWPPPQQSTPLITPVTPAAPSSSTPNFLKPGDTVIIYGLQSEAGQKLNGKSGVITKYVEDSGRFVVELTKGISSVHSLKRENVRAASDPPTVGL
mmetsp:Transcript_1915/g.4312  ORF Transcript_1915/g.4312 Transcript_1915/m.4312 type:complete len:232 (-) Transcript_1915:45-740(-)|eukprot:CAMPEP_0180478494 /NCGR_PEP_ID=MMETSP1036_2-20121128/32806_1 /TAXON_ID=632150 /ORGANISM="Azadinium spinosum, Strain 3D9" /LENGTH=231 /DNA_ID=CAMNT_0022486013 /DNA_START=49 /DNA_END=745 /DNA_ORIENTATION=+